MGVKARKRERSDARRLPTGLSIRARRALCTGQCERAILIRMWLRGSFLLGVAATASQQTSGDSQQSRGALPRG